MEQGNEKEYAVTSIQDCSVYDRTKPVTVDMIKSRKTYLTYDEARMGYVWGVDKAKARRYQTRQLKDLESIPIIAGGGAEYELID